MADLAIKTRFCPSPTGHIHLGNARTALFNALYAKANQGIFLLRIEDTDLERSKPEYVDALKEDLLWLGLDWQEGPDRDQPAAPYFQSQREAIYDRYYQELEQKQLAYPCFCSEEELAVMRKIQRAAGKPPRYAGTCLNLSAEEIAEKIQLGLKPTLRFSVPKDAVIEFNDIVRGIQRFAGNDLGDFIIRRADGTAPFMFCNAIDDALMRVTHALRGEDHLTNTPRQIMILRALNLSIPSYGHISLIIGPDGSPLSKRHGSRSISELRKLGFFPDAINNYMARLGHYYENDEFMNLTQLAQNFKLEQLGRAPARFDYNQLLRRQQEAVSLQNEDLLWQWLDETLRSLIPEQKRTLFLEAVKPNVTFPDDVLKWAKIFFADIEELNSEILQSAGKQFFTVAQEGVETFGADYKKVSQHLQEKLAVKGKNLFQPLRIALTGEVHGPEMGAIFQLLAKDEIMRRLKKAGDAI